MTMSIGASISSSCGKISAALPSSPIESGRRSSRAATAAGHGVLDRVGLLVEVAVLDAPGDPGLVDVDADRDAVVHGHRERLRAAHAAEPGGQGDGAGEGAAEALVGHRGERLERALQDALRADVDPRAGGHLAVHRQAEVLEPAELLPVGPVADQVGVGDQHPRRPLVGAHHADRLARLHQHRLVVAERGAACARGRRTPPSCARPCRCRRRRRGPRGARRSRGRGCSSASAAAPRSATSARSARCRGRRGWAAAGCVGHASSPITSSTAARTAPESTSSTAVSISGDRWRSGPGPSMPASRSSRDHGGGRRRRRQRRPEVERAGGGQHLDRHHPGQPVDRAPQLARRRPAHRHVVLLHGARRDRVDRGRERPAASAPRRSRPACTARSCARCRRPGRRRGTAAARGCGPCRGTGRYAAR